MLSFDEFRVSRYYRPRVLGMEEESQDAGDMRRAHRKDQEEQYAKHVAQHEDRTRAVAETGEERRAKEFVAQHVAQQDKKELRNNNGGASKSRAEYFRKYRKQRKCRHCGKLNP